jgi:uncharacterized BrkB/YihY/UPF0761 family membrane protein
MSRPSEPLVSRSFVVFLTALASLVMAMPFADRNDWQGWVASCAIIAALGTMLAMWLYRTIQNVSDWWHDDRESPF